ncbi:Histone transcription regulator 3 [Chytriomyces hyalinus]|nr:Histone transcription regulator 3 [Chytriomyces hyalinus]
MFSCLNDAEDTDERERERERDGDTGEKEVQACLDAFRRLLALQHRTLPTHHQQVIDGYRQLLANNVVAATLDELPANVSVSDSPIHALHFVVHRNYALLVADSDLNLAATHMLKAAHADPSSSSTWALAAKFALQNTNYATACMAYERSLRNAQTRIEHVIALKGLSKASFHAGDFDSSSYFSRAALAIDPKFADAHELTEAMENESVATRVKKPPKSITIPSTALSVSQMECKQFADALISKLDSNSIEFTLSGLVAISVRAPEKDDVPKTPVSMMKKADRLEQKDDDIGTNDDMMEDFEIPNSNEVDALGVVASVNDATAAVERASEVEGDKPLTEDESMGHERKTTEDRENKKDDEESVHSGEASPVKRRRRWSKEITRASKRVKGDRDLEKKRESEIENDLANTEEFYSTVNEDILPEAFPITFGEDIVLAKKYHQPFTAIFEKRLSAVKNLQVQQNDTSSFSSGRSTPTRTNLEEDIFQTPRATDTWFDSHLEELHQKWTDVISSGDSTIPSLYSVANEFLYSLFFTHYDEAGDMKRVFLESVWPEGMRQRVLKLVIQIEENGCGASVHTNQLHLGRTTAAETVKILELSLSICEFLFDTIFAIESGSISTADATASSVTCCLETWWAVLNPVNQLDVNSAELAGNEWLLRKLWLKAQMAEKFSTSQQALDGYKQCLTFALQQSVSDVCFPNSQRCPVLSKETIKSRLQTLSLEKHLLDAESAFAAKDFQSVYTALHPLLFQDSVSFGAWFKAVLFPDVCHGSVDGPTETDDSFFLTTAAQLNLAFDQRSRILKMLWRSYDALGQTTESFMCRIFLLISELKVLLEKKDLIDNVKQISIILKSLLETTDEAAVTPTMPFMGIQDYRSMFSSCVATVFALVRLAWVVVKQCGQLKYRSDTVLTNFCVRSWCFMFYMCKSLEMESDDVSEDVGLDWAFFAHAQLGEVGLCGRDSGSLQKLIVRHCLAKEGGESMSELYQCFCCMYGVVNTVSYDTPLLEHNCPTVPFNKAAAATVFTPLSAFIKDKLRTKNFRAITSDMRDTIEAIAEKFPEPPFKNSDVAFNRSLIDRFLLEGVHSVQKRPLSALFLSADKIPNLAVYQDLYYIQGKLACIQKRTLVGIKTKKSFESLELAAEKFLLNVYMNAFNVNAWVLAADVFCSLSYEYLSWSASDLLANLELLRSLQLKAYHCYEQAGCLLKERQFTVLDDGQIEDMLSVSDQAMLIWGNFGYLCYSMVARPMNCIATKSSQLKGLAIWSARYTTKTGSNLESLPSPAESEEIGRSILLKRGIDCFKRAHRVDPSDWRYPYMIGKFRVMMDADCRSVISSFNTAISLLPAEWSTKEQEKILDVHYSLLSYLCKGLVQGKLEPLLVVNCVEDATLNKDGALSQSAFEEQTDPYLRAHQLILQELGYMKMIDKKKWQHRPYWKAFWIYKNVFNDAERAKGEILSIFQLRSNARSFINFWRPEFERPGRHFVYVHKYTMALVSVLKQAKDLESLRHLVRKCQKAYDVLLYPRTVWKSGFDAMTELLGEKVNGIVWVQFVKTVPQKEFLSHAPGVERKMFAGTSDEKSEDASLLHTAFTLKKLNENMEDETVLSRILVQLYCKLFLANMEAIAEVEENETLTEDTSVFFTIVLRRCLIACKVPASKRIQAEDGGESGATGVATEAGNARADNLNDADGAMTLPANTPACSLNALDASVETRVDDTLNAEPSHVPNELLSDAYMEDSIVSRQEDEEKSVDQQENSGKESLDMSFHTAESHVAELDVADGGENNTQMNVDEYASQPMLDETSD